MGKRKQKAAPVEAQEETAVEPTAEELSLIADAGEPTAEVIQGEVGAEVVEYADEGTGDDAAATAESNDEPTEAAPVDTAAQAEADEAADAQVDSERAKLGNNSAALKKAFDKLKKDVRGLGEQQGVGAKSLVALAALVTQAAMNGVIVPKPTTDSVYLYKEFRRKASEAAGKFAVVDMSDKVLKAQASKLNAFIHLGNSSDGFAPHPDDDDAIRDAADLIDRATKLHVRLQGNSDEKLRNPKAYDALIDIARAQMDDKRKGIWMHSEEVYSLLVAEDGKKEKTGLDLVKSALETLEKAAKGREETDSRPAREPVEHESIGHAIGHLSHLLGEMDPAWVEAREKAQAAEAEKVRKRQLKNAAA